MSKTDIWMPLYIADYLADTQHLTRDEHGGYLLLLMAYWRNGGPLQDDDKRLAAIAKATQREWKSLRATLAEFFTIADGLWVHKRADKEIKDAAENSLRNTNRAKVAAAKRWGKQSSNDAPSSASSSALSTPNALPDQCPSPSPTPLKPPIAGANVDLGGGTVAGSICARLKNDGVQGVNPQNPKLLKLLEEGLTADEITAIGPEAASKSKGFAWVLAAAEGRRRDAAAVATLPAMPAEEWFLSASGIESKAVEHGITQQRDEPFPAFKARVYEAAGVTDDMVRRAKIDRGERV